MTISDFEVRKKFMEAIKSGRYLITISTTNQKTKRLDHYAVFQNYPTDDLIPSLNETNKLIFDQLPEDMVLHAENNPEA